MCSASARSGCESIIYGHAALFMLAAAWTLREGGHVRVDIFYADASPRTQGAGRSPRRAAAADSVLLVLVMVVAALCGALMGDPRALARNQRTAVRLLLKTLIPLFALLMALQGIAQAIRALRCVSARRGHERCRKSSPSCMVVAVCVALMAGYPVALHARRRVARLRGARPSARHDGSQLPRRAAAAHLRRDDQRGAARDPAVHLHGRDAGALAHRRGPARDHGAAVRPAARRASVFRSSIVGVLLAAAKGVVGATVVDHGADRAAGDAALRL